MLGLKSSMDLFACVFHHLRAKILKILSATPTDLLTACVVYVNQSRQCAFQWRISVQFFFIFMQFSTKIITNKNAFQ